MLNRLFVREETEIEYVLKKNRIKVGVLGNAPMAGTSFLATSIASEISLRKDKRVAYVEINGGEDKLALFDSLGMDKRFAGRTFYDFYEEVFCGKNISELLNLDERINWALTVPNSLKSSVKPELDVTELCRLINNISADVVICDITYGKETDKIIQEMDVLIFVVDPLPSKLLYGYDILCRMKKYQSEGGNIIWVLNKYNEGISKRELGVFLKQREFFKLPVIPAEEIYQAEYNCRLPYSVKKIKELVKDTVGEISHKIITIM